MIFLLIFFSVTSILFPPSIILLFGGQIFNITIILIFFILTIINININIIFIFIDILNGILW